MANKVIMPKQGLLMEEGTITRWLFKEGEEVQEGKPLFEMETDKLTITIDAPVSGTLIKIVHEDGDIVPITQTIAIIGQPGEDITGLLAEISPNISPSQKLIIPSNETSSTPDSGKAPLQRKFITPRARRLAADNQINIEDLSGSGPEGIVIERDVKKHLLYEKVNKRISPLAKKVAELNEVSLNDVEGTGTNGKVIKADIEKLISQKSRIKASDGRDSRLIPFKGMRKIISDRMMQSLHGTAQANHRMHVDMSEIIRFRESLKAENIKVSFNDIMVKVVSRALIDYPIMNSSMTEEGILLKGYVNIGLAVSVDNGLIVPVIKNADLLTLNQISDISTNLINKAKNGRLLPEEFSEGTFTITNLGMFNIDEFTPIINPPEVGILGMGKITKTPVVENDSVIIKPIMVLSLTYDHRVVDGAPAAQFLQRIQQILQNPYLLI